MQVVCSTNWTYTSLVVLKCCCAVAAGCVGSCPVGMFSMGCGCYVQAIRVQKLPCLIGTRPCSVQRCHWHDHCHYLRSCDFEARQVCDHPNSPPSALLLIARGQHLADWSFLPRIGFDISPKKVVFATAVPPAVGARHPDCLSLLYLPSGLCSS